MGEKGKGTNDCVTLMMIPHNAGKSYSLSISRRVFISLVVLWLATIGGASYILTRHIDYEITKRANIQLTEKNSYFVQKLSSASDAFQRVAKMEEELRAMLKMKTKKALLEYTGEGGPTTADQAALMQALSNRSTLTQGEIDESLGYLNKSAQIRLESYGELKKYVTNQRSLLASRPTTWPVRGWVTSRFGYRVSPFFEGTSFHQGLDIANEEGTSIKSPADGIVIFNGWQGSYGRLTVVDHGYGFSTRFGHLDRSLVNIGQRVKRGQVIGFMGNTGRSTAPHLHFEVRLNGVPVNPLKFLKD
jgi:murein DD-endopeptidase MepM/ murein hydrolase activator NlpD